MVWKLFSIARPTSVQEVRGGAQPKVHPERRRQLLLGRHREGLRPPHELLVLRGAQQERPHECLSFAVRTNACCTKRRVAYWKSLLPTPIQILINKCQFLIIPGDHTGHPYVPWRRPAAHPVCVPAIHGTSMIFMIIILMVSCLMVVLR